jgi:hypothetical protein
VSTRFVFRERTEALSYTQRFGILLQNFSPDLIVNLHELVLMAYNTQKAGISSKKQSTIKERLDTARKLAKEGRYINCS